MGKLPRRPAAFVTLLFCLAASAIADPSDERMFILQFPVGLTGPGQIQALDVDTEGNAVVAENYSTFGTGDGLQTPMEIVISSDGEFLYAANNVDHSIAEYRVLADGTLEAIAGTPFPTSGGPPVRLTVHPTAALLYAIVGVDVAVFDIGADGGLTEIQRTRLSVPSGLDVAPDGEFLYVSARFGPDEGLVVLRLNADGTVMAREASPIGYLIDRPAEVVVDSSGGRVHMLDLDTGVTTFGVDSISELTAIDQTGWGTFTSTFALSDDDRYLFVGEGVAPSIRGLAIDATGVPKELPGSPFAAEAGGVIDLVPVGDLLWRLTRSNANLQPFRIGADGTLTPLAAPLFLDGYGSPMAAAHLALRELDIGIDVRPNSPANPVNPSSRGLIAVAVLGAGDLAVSGVDPGASRFGPDEASPTGRHRVTDVNDDGEQDLVLTFRLQETGIACDDGEATLSGALRDGRAIRGVDTIRTVGCNGPGGRNGRH